MCVFPGNLKSLELFNFHVKNISNLPSLENLTICSDAVKNIDNFPDSLKKIHINKKFLNNIYNNTPYNLKKLYYWNNFEWKYVDSRKYTKNENNFIKIEHGNKTIYIPVYIKKKIKLYADSIELI